jgi:hypothetical protein
MAHNRGVPFEPLQTDEKIDKPIPRERDMDSLMLAGCTVFVAVSIFAYLLAVWPHFLFPETYQLRALALTAALGMAPALLFGAYCARRFGLAAACGFVSGALAFGVFLYLRLNEAVVIGGLPSAPEPEYPAVWQWLAPTAWVLTAAGIALVFTPKEPE